VTIQRTKQYFDFGPFRIDLAERLLLRDGETVPLTPKVFDTLLVLVENSGHILTKDEVMNQVWAGSVVEEANLTRNISVLRKALGESPDHHQYIETIPWRGYRFVASVRQVRDENVDLTVEESTRSYVLIEQERETYALDGEPAPESASIEKPFSQGDKGKRLLKWRVSLAGLVVCAGVAITAATLFLPVSRNQPPAPPAIGSIAVLPMENLSGDPAQEYFADGMTEALINNLARIRALRVISRTSVMRYKRSQKSLPEIARELTVDAVITGSVQRSGGRVRVTAQLLHAATDAHLWAKDYERDLGDLLKLEGEVARAVAEEIRIQVAPEERARLASARRVHPQAHEAYLLGRHHFSRDDEQGWKRAIEYFERAIQMAPDYAATYAGLSDAWVRRGLSGTVDFKEAESPARRAALKALELDEQLAEAHLSLASIKQHYDWDWTGAEQECRRALELDPGSLDVHTAYGYLLMHLGRHDEAIHEGQITVQLDPVSSRAHSALGRFLYRAHRYGEALPHLQHAVELEPRSLTPNYRLGDLYTQMGRYEEALAAYQRSGEAIPKGGYPHAGIARVYALMGKQREARQMIRGRKNNPYLIAAVYVALGDKDEAFRILEKAVEEHQYITPLKVEPPLEGLHSDPRWMALLSRMNFPTE
jgi:TolB-like protein/DNA-binding winged helix-turn-helix (wHTH) protein/Tfp pilus assembly protein PilF